jgi:hypothetical protein
MTLSRTAMTFRALHTAIAGAELAALGYVWFCAITRRRDRRLGIAIAALGAEGIGLVIGKGNCPLGPVQEHLGDPIPLFELVLPKRAAKAAVPILTGVAALGVLLALVRRPRRSESPAAGAYRARPRYCARRTAPVRWHR